MNILITGSASGIGFDVGMKLIEKGYHVFFTVENDKQLQLLKEKLDGVDNAGSFRLDLTKKEDRKKLEDFDVDILISNAAVNQGGSILDIDMKDVKKCYDVNVFYNFDIIKIVLNNMLKKDKGKIIVISSMLSNIPLPFFGIYGSSKASLTYLSKVLKKELKFINKKISLKIVEPGIYKTGFNRYMIESSKTDKYFLFNKSIYELEKEILNFVGKSKLDSITNKILQAISDRNDKTMYRSPLLHNILLKIYLKLKG